MPSLSSLLLNSEVLRFGHWILGDMFLRWQKHFSVVSCRDTGEVVVFYVCLNLIFLMLLQLLHYKYIIHLKSQDSWWILRWIMTLHLTSFMFESLVWNHCIIICGLLAGTDVHTHCYEHKNSCFAENHLLSYLNILFCYFDFEILYLLSCT